MIESRYLKGRGRRTEFEPNLVYIGRTYLKKGKEMEEREGSYQPKPIIIL